MNWNLIFRYIIFILSSFFYLIVSKVMLSQIAKLLGNMT